MIYSRKTDIFIIVFALDEETTFKSALGHIQALRVVAKQDARYMFLGNKSDTVMRQVGLREVVLAAGSVPATYHEVTALGNSASQSVARFFVDVVRETRQQLEFRAIGRDDSIFPGEAWRRWFWERNGAWTANICGEDGGLACDIM